MRTLALLVLTLLAGGFGIHAISGDESHTLTLVARDGDRYVHIFRDSQERQVREVGGENALQEARQGVRPKRPGQTWVSIQTEPQWATPTGELGDWEYAQLHEGVLIKVDVIADPIFLDSRRYRGLDPNNLNVTGEGFVIINGVMTITDERLFLSTWQG